MAEDPKLLALLQDAMDFQDMATTEELDQLERELYSAKENKPND